MIEYLIIKKGYNKLKFELVDKNPINMNSNQIRFILESDGKCQIVNHNDDETKKFISTNEFLKFVEQYTGYEDIILEIDEHDYYYSLKHELRDIASNYELENEDKYDIKEIEKRNLTKDTNEINKLESKLKKYILENDTIPNIVFLVGTLAIVGGYIYTSFFSKTALNINFQEEKFNGIKYEKVIYEDGVESNKIITEIEPENFTDKIYYYDGYVRDGDSYISNVEVYNIISDNIDELLKDATFSDDLSKLINHLELSEAFVSEISEIDSTDPIVIYEKFNINDKEAISEFVDRHDLLGKIALSMGYIGSTLLLIQLYAYIISNTTKKIINKKYGRENYQSISSELDAVKYQYKKLYGEEKTVQRKKNK